MVFEFAIEPDLVASWGDLKNYQIFYDKFGIGQPRIMAEYPILKNWRRRVLQAASGRSDMEMQRVTALITRLSETMIRRRTMPYDGNIKWLENAQKEDENDSFHAILALSNDFNHPNVLDTTMLGISNNQRWDINKQLPDVPRKASDMADAVRPLLKNSRTVVFIDPYFMAGDNWLKWQRPFSAFMQELSTNRHEPSDIHVEVQASADLYNAPSTNDFIGRCRQRLTNCIPNGLTVSFKRWKEKPEGKKLHDRYIITEIGGVDFSIGLDEGAIGQTQKISLLERNTYTSVWNNYLGNSPAFNVEKNSVFTVVGS